MTIGKEKACYGTENQEGSRQPFHKRIAAVAAGAKAPPIRPPLKKNPKTRERQAGEILSFTSAAIAGDNPASRVPKLNRMMINEAKLEARAVNAVNADQLVIAIATMVLLSDRSAKIPHGVCKEA
jgi:hypothetical protein